MPTREQVLAFIEGAQGKGVVGGHKHHDRPIGLLDTQGYWAPMLQFLRHAVTEGFMGDDQMAMLHTDDAVDRLLDTLAAQAGDPDDDNFSRI